jgi:hypothetical protein
MSIELELKPIIWHNCKQQNIIILVMPAALTENKKVWVAEIDDFFEEDAKLYHSSINNAKQLLSYFFCFTKFMQKWWGYTTLIP